MSAAPDVLRSLTSDCVHCGFCLPTCPTYLLWSEEMDSPRGRIQLMESHLDGTISLNQTVVGHFDKCLGCMACVTACPSGVQYEKLIEATRETVETTTTRSFGDRFVRGALFKLLPYPRRMGPALRLAPLGRKLPLPGRLGVMTEIAPPWRSTEKPEEVTPASGETRGRVGILTGCVQSVVFGTVNAATARVLAADGYEVVAPPQGCCGALSMHAGRGDEGRAFARRVIESFDGVETVIVNTSGCGSHLKELGHVLGDDPAWAERAAEFSSRVRDLGEFLAGVEPRAPRHPLNLTVAMQDSCHLRHAQRLPVSSATSLRRIPGLKVIEPAEQDICCGSAGIYNITQADAARQLGDRKAGHVLATGAQVYASANPGCLVQVATALRRAGSPMPALHPIEIVDASIRNAGAAGLLRRPAAEGTFSASRRGACASRRVRRARPRAPPRSPCDNDQKSANAPARPPIANAATATRGRVRRIATPASTTAPPPSRRSSHQNRLPPSPSVASVSQPAIPAATKPRPVTAPITIVARSIVSSRRRRVPHLRSAAVPDWSNALPASSSTTSSIATTRQ